MMMIWRICWRIRELMGIYQRAEEHETKLGGIFDGERELLRLWKWQTRMLSDQGTWHVEDICKLLASWTYIAAGVPDCRILHNGTIGRCPVF